MISRKRLGGFVLAVTLLPGSAPAQTVAHSFEALQRILKAEEIVVVIDRAARETRGKVAEISASSLVLLLPAKTSGGLDTYTGAKRTFDEDAVAEILESDSSGRKGTRIYLALAGSFQDLQQTLKAGQQVVLTDDSGGHVRGKVAELSASALVVLAPERRTFAQGNVREIRLGEDPLRNGTLIGLGVGALSGLGFIHAEFAACGAGCEAPAFSAVAGPAVGIGAGVGALVGYLLDRARKGAGEVIFSAATEARAKAGVTLSPVLGKDRQRVLVSVRF